MSYLAFEHAIAVKNPIKRAIMRMGSGGELVHVEFILPTYGNIRASSWNNFGVGFKNANEVDFSDYVVLDIGNFDKAIFDYFNSKSGNGYDLKGVVTNMILKLNQNQKDKSFCSEIVFDVLKNIVGVKLPDVPPSQISPNGLYQIVKELGFYQVFL